MEALHALNPRQAAGLKRPRSHVPLVVESSGATTTASSFRPLGTLLEERATALSGVVSEGEVALPLATPPTISADCKSWGLHSGLARALESEGVGHFFPVQRALIPLLLAANSWDDPTLGDVCVSAPTGSGKTLAYALPLLHAILKAREGVRGGAAPLPAGLHALIVLPTRDLAVQVHAVLVKLSEVAAGGSVRVLAATGQASFASEQAALENSSREGGVDILVASPGRLMDHLDGTPALTAALRGLRVLVVDEADRLLAESYQDWVRRINLCIFKAEDPGVLGAYMGGWEGGGGGGQPQHQQQQQQQQQQPMHLSRVWRGEGSRVGGVITALTHPTTTASTLPTGATSSTSSLLPPWMQSALPPTATAAATLATPDPLPAPYRRILCSATLSRNPQKLAAMGLWHPNYITAPGPAVHSTTKTPAAASKGGKEGGGGKEEEEGEEEEDKAEGGLLGSPAGKKVYTLPSTLHQALCVCSAGEKTVALHHILKLLEGGGSGSASTSTPALCALVFTNSVDTAHRLTRLLQLLGGLKGAVVEFSATLSQSKRTAVLTAAAAGAVSVLVASDAAARGLDLPALPAVIHYDVPSRTKTYVHRVGRAARAGREGVSYTLLRPDQVRHFKGLLQRTRGAHTCIKETLPRALVGEYAGRVQDCLTALKGVLEEEAGGTLKASKAVEALVVVSGGEGGVGEEGAGGGSDV